MNRTIFEKALIEIVTINPFYYNNQMTTAHRPTWKPSFGLSDSVNKGYVPTRAYSARDLPSYLKLKDRKLGQGTLDELKQKDFKSDLLQRQALAKRKKNGDLEIIQDTEHNKNSIYNDEVDVIGNYEPQARKKLKKDEELVDLADNPFPEDADSQSFINSDSEEQVRKKPRIHSQSENDDSDDSAELLKEYERIKMQREKQQLHKREEKAQQSQANRQAELLKGNPLVDSSYSLSKRWYEDTVFRNQARKLQEQKGFINDYVRSDFHRKFMHRFICR